MKNQLLLAISLFTVGATTAPAALVFEFNAAVTSASGPAFSVNDNITITATTNDPAVVGIPSHSDYGFQSGTDALWYDENGVTPPLWSNLVITGATGTYTPPTGSAVYDLLGYNGTNSYVYVASDFGNLGIGIGGEMVTHFSFRQSGNISGWQDYPNDATATLDNVFNPGTYGITPTSFTIHTTGGVYALTGSQMTISDTAASVIPEPSTYLAAASAIGLAGFVYVRRRKQAQAAE